jgi:hypothetical protein
MAKATTTDLVCPRVGIGPRPGPGEGRGPEWIADGYAAAGLGRGLGVTAGPAVLTYG